MKRSFVVVDMGFGDTGKGSCVDSLCRKTKIDGILKFNGGSNCSHQVCLPDGRSHRFSQWGSASFQGVPTYLGPNFIINVGAMLNEAKNLISVGVEGPCSFLRVSPDCLITTPYHQWLNQIKELARGDDRHGSCGHGIGETRSYWLKHGQDAPKACDLKRGVDLGAKLELLRQRILPEVYEVGQHPQCQELIERFLDVGPGEMARDLIHDSRFLRLQAWGKQDWQTVVCEGSQGLLLDESWGFHPFTTWSTTTDRHAREMLAEVGCDDVTTIGCIRAFTTRHGAGPLPTYSLGLTQTLTDPGNPENEFQGALRVGYFDFSLYRYALAVQPVDALAVSWLDQFNETGDKVATGYRMPWGDEFHLKYNPYPSPTDQRMAGDSLSIARPIYQTVTRDEFLSLLGQRILVKGFGPTFEDRIWEGSL